MSPTKRIEDLVYSGKVMDDHGNWITIAEQLQKEKRFLNHLEQGEILVNGTWIKMSELAKTPPTPPEKTSQATDEPTVNEETTLVSPLASPEETVSFSTETIVDVPLKHLDPPSKHDQDILIRAPEETVSFSTETIREISSEDHTAGSGIHPDFPPETKSLFFEPVGTSETGTSVKSDAIPPKLERKDTATEFQETVLYNIKILKNTPTPIDTQGSSTSSQSIPGHRKSTLEALHSSPPKKPGPKAGLPGPLLVVITITIVFLIVLLRLFL